MKKETTMKDIFFWILLASAFAQAGFIYGSEHPKISLLDSMATTKETKLGAPGHG